MKTTISSQQLVYFRRHGRIRFENFPQEFEEIKKQRGPKSTPRDLWRTSPFVKKLILHTFGPIALELTKKPSIRIACDQWIDTKSTLTRMQDMFCFQGLACIFVLYQDASLPELGTILEVFEPSSLTSLLPQEGYLIAFGLENAVLIENPKDPFTAATRNLGYVYGDRLVNAHHPLIYQK
jgi:hypothetical protein